jgi:tripeptide aminopeptidase
MIISGGSDASEYNANGIETVVLGTGVRSEHTTEEHIHVDDMEKAVRIVKEIFSILSDG